MKCALVTTLFLTLLSFSAVCSAQHSHIPFAQIELEARTTPISDSSSTSGVTDSSSNSSTSDSAVAEPVSYESQRIPATKRRWSHVSGLWLMNGVHAGTAALDITLTKHCIDNHTCREGNPLMPSSIGGQIGIDFALVSYSSYVSYRLKKHNSRAWWISPALGTSTHIVGIASNLGR